MSPHEVHHRPSTSVGSLHRRRPPTIAGLGLAIAICAAGGPGPAVSASLQARPSEASCEPHMLVLQGLNSTSDASVDAVSDSGWVAGTSWEDASPRAAVVWTDPERVIDTGVGGVTLPNGSTVTAWVVDMNEVGTVAINRWKLSPAGSVVSQDAVVWNLEDGVTVLPTSTYRPLASIAAINDQGHVLGWVTSLRHGSVPVVWRDGQRTRLPVPPRLEAYASDINNDGLVVGTAHSRDFSVRYSWTWSGGPKLIRLRAPDTTASADATNVNDSGLIIGGQHVGPGDGMRTILWRNRTASPQRLMRIQTVDLHNTGYLAAVEPGFRGYGATAYVGHRRDGGVKAQLPPPPVALGSRGWTNVRAAAVARGHSSFAPHGGVTVGGFAQDFDVMVSQAILWTCSQAWLNR